MFALRTLMKSKVTLGNKLGLQMSLAARPAALTQVVQRAYHENVIDHYEKPRNVGSLNAKDLDVGTGLVGAPACGDVMRLQIKVNKENNKIEKAVFKVKIEVV